MSVQLPPFFLLHFFDPNNTGIPLQGGKLFTYIAGTSTKQATWTDYTQTIQNTNPIILNSRGECSMWLDPTLIYKLVLSPANDSDPPTSPLNTVDNVNAPALNPRTAAEIAASVTPTNYAYPELNILRYGADPSGIADSFPAINSASLVAAQHGGAMVSYPAGTYLVNTTITMLQNVTHAGAGINATTVKTNGNIPVFTMAGGATVTINCGGVRDMAIHGSWAASPSNTLSYGISCTGSNGTVFENLRILGCDVGFYGAFNFESFVTNVKVLGAGGDLNNQGFVLDYTNSTNVNNAFYMVNCGAFGTQSDGWDIRNGNGSNFVNCAAEACGGYGFSIGFSGTGTINPQFMQFSNCTGDSCTSSNWLIQGTVSLPAQDMLFSNCWSGLCATTNWAFINCINTIFTGCNGISAAQEAIFLDGGDSMTIVGFTGRNFNTSTSGHAGINILNSNNNFISGCDLSTANTSGGTFGIAENGTSNNNVIDGNLVPQGGQVLGNATRFINSKGFNPVGISGPTSVGASPATITAGPSPETHYLTQGSTNTATVTKGGKTLGTLTAGTTLVVELDPNTSYVVTWVTTTPNYIKDIH